MNTPSRVLLTDEASMPTIRTTVAAVSAQWRWRSGSGSGCTSARWSGRWPAPPPRKAPENTENRGERADPGDVARYEQLRRQVLAGDPAGWRLGLGVLQRFHLALDLAGGRLFLIGPEQPPAQGPHRRTMRFEIVPPPPGMR